MTIKAQITNIETGDEVKLKVCSPAPKSDVPADPVVAYLGAGESTTVSVDFDEKISLTEVDADTLAPVPAPAPAPTPAPAAPAVPATPTDPSQQVSS